MPKAPTLDPKYQTRHLNPQGCTLHAYGRMASLRESKDEGKASRPKPETRNPNP
jgi:hypothetical protein